MRIPRRWAKHSPKRSGDGRAAAGQEDGELGFGADDDRDMEEMLKRSGIAALAFIGIAAATVARAAPAEFIVVQAGDLPVILTAPHGGTEMAGLPTRNGGTTLRDAQTLELTQNLARGLAARLGAAPYVVAAKFSRKVIDANRAPAEAFEDASAQPLYNAYHAQISRFVADAKARFPAGVLLIDVHGQSAEPNAVVRGTRNGATVRSLIERGGVAALIGPQSILGVLQAKGIQVIPANTPPPLPAEDSRYDGGFTVATYSRAAGGGINTIQLEIGAALRARASFSDDLADAIAAFARAYLLKAPA
jgi:N-formylglutamate amidohydrolase